MIGRICLLWGHWRTLWRNGVFWPLLWLTILHPRTEKHLWVTPHGYEIRLRGAT